MPRITWFSIAQRLPVSNDKGVSFITIYSVEQKSVNVPTQQEDDVNSVFKVAAAYPLSHDTVREFLMLCLLLVVLSLI